MIISLLDKIQKKIARKRLLKELKIAAEEVFPDRRVLFGPFKGLEYPSWSSHGSAVYSKLLGTYEAELHPFIEKVIASCPKTIIDVGCAEGFYAVGCAKNLPKAEVIAADLSEEARQLCIRMAKANGVADNIKVVGRITYDNLLALAAKPPGLLISDCEGGENELFDENLFDRFRSWHILIEMHEFILPGIEHRLISEASKSHCVEIVNSVDDYRREQLWPRKVIKHLPSQVRHEFYREGRPGMMRWLCGVPISEN